MSKIYPDLAKALTEIVDKMDASLRESGYAGPPIDMYLAGGMAVNYYCGTRYTEDVDASFSRRVIFSADEIVVDYVRADGKRSFIYLDTNYNPTFALMHENFEESALPWAHGGMSDCLVKLKILSPVDLAVSKIARFSERDREDIKALAFEGLITESVLRERADDALLDYVGNLVTVKTGIKMACDDVKRISELSNTTDLVKQWNAVPATEAHSGMIKAISDEIVIQHIGQGRHVAWETTTLTGSAIEVGKFVQISADGQVQPTIPKSSELGR